MYINKPLIKVDRTKMPSRGSRTTTDSKKKK